MAQKSNTGEKIVAAGAGLATLAAAAAGAFFLYGTKEGAKRRKQIRGWAIKMKGEVVEKMEQMKDVTEEKYREAVDGVAKRYQNVKSIDPTEVSAMVADLKNHWKNIKRQIEGGSKKKSVKKRPSAKKKAS
jgi:L-lysine 2,3-aminomutase